MTLRQRHCIQLTTLSIRFGSKLEKEEEEEALDRYDDGDSHVRKVLCGSANIVSQVIKVVSLDLFHREETTKYYELNPTLCQGASERASA